LTLKYFFDVLVLINDQLILIFYENMGLNKRDWNEKGAMHGWHAISFVKDAFWYLNFKNHADYTVSVPQYFSNSMLVKKFNFVIF
jgi:hypothetical protein